MGRGEGIEAKRRNGEAGGQRHLRDFRHDGCGVQNCCWEKVLLELERTSISEGAGDAMSGFALCVWWKVMMWVMCGCHSFVTDRQTLAGAWAGGTEYGVNLVLLIKILCLVLCVTWFPFVIFLADLKVFSYILCLMDSKPHDVM